MSKPEIPSGVSDMSMLTNCLGCGARIHTGAPEGLCPRCLMGLAFGLPPGGTLPASPKTPAIGENRSRLGDYELLEEIARGGMGIVYRARQVSLNRIVAVKVLLFGQFASAQFVKRFRAEAEAVASLSHPNIVSIHAVGDEQNQHYFSMDYIEGSNLAELVREKPLPAVEAVKLLKIITEAVEYAHGHGILHRDLKPSNVLLDKGGQPHITDFGLAKRLSGGNDITLTGQVFGSPAYMAPEQASAGEAPVGRACDIYSLGAILYYLLTGRPPFVAESLEATLAQVLSAEVLSPRKLTPNVPGDVETICLKCLQREPGRRYPSAQGLAEDLDRFLEGKPIWARPVGFWEKSWRWSARNPAISGLGVLVVALLVAFLIYTLFSSARIRHEATRARGAEQRATTELWQSYLAQARAERRSGQAGQRYASLEAIRRATAIRPSLELRNEAIAALVLPDVRLIRTWPYNDNIAAYSRTLEKFAIQRENGEIGVCQASNGVEIVRLPAVGYTVRGIAGFTPDENLLAVNYHEDVNYVWDIAARKPALGPLPGLICCLVPDASELVIGSTDGTLDFYSLQNGERNRSVPVSEPLSAIIIEPRFQLMGGFRYNSSKFHLLDFPSGHERFTLDHPANVGSAAFSSDGEFVAIGCYDRRVHIWNTRSGASCAVLEGHENNIVALGFNHAGSLLASIGWDNTFRLWDTANWKQVLVGEGMSYEVKFDPADRFLAHLQHGGDAGVLELASRVGFRRLYVPPDAHTEGWCVCLSPDGRLVATAHTDGVALRSITTGAELAWLPIGYCRAVMFTPDGSGLITSGGGGVGLWPITTSIHDGKEEVVLGERRSIRDGLQFLGATLSGDGRWVAAANGPAGSVAFYEVAHPENRFALTSLPNIQFVSAPADMHWVAGGTWGGTGVKVWNVPERRLECTLPLPGTATVAFSPDGKLVATGTSLYEVWQAGSWRKLYEISKPDPESRYGKMIFSPDSRWLAVLKSFRNIVLLEAATGRELATLQAPNQPAIAAFGFSPDGSQLIALQADQSLQIWDLPALRRELAALNLDW